MSVELHLDDPPHGFSVGTSDSGELQIRYRTAGMGSLFLFFVVWLILWTGGCMAGTDAALLGDDGINWLLVSFMVLLWAVDLFIIGHVIWFFWSVTSFVFDADELVVERSLLGFRWRRTFPSQEITAIRQFNDCGPNTRHGGTFITWGLVVETKQGKGVYVLSQQPRDQTAWLGPILAQWAGVPCIPYEGPAAYSTL